MPMESEGPRTLLRARRRETAAEQMSRQQKEIEERSGPVRDEVQQAVTHNETHPKLKRQLEKRRSLIECDKHREKNALAHKTMMVQISGDSCAAAQQETGGNCVQLRRQLKRPLDRRCSPIEFLDRPVKRMRLCHADSDKGSRPHRRRPARRKLDRPRRTRNINRVAKRRERRPCTCSKCFKKPVCRKNIANICVYVANKRIGTDTLPLGENAAILKPKGSIQGSNHSVGIHTPASRHQSVSSYNSFDSSDHPPVV
ncbi:uncharacterized protein isoform X1 [Choristoneura fumiferana]|uniref:uncharacterized protein isoform X1 n=2 Tax=Choristoneura fumiferana TaxID=7141 RepID=UPI003D1581FB